MSYRDFVSIHHLPTGLEVRSDENRSQYKNKLNCVRQLRSKLYDLEHCNDKIKPTKAQIDIADYILKRCTTKV